MKEKINQVTAAVLLLAGLGQLVYAAFNGRLLAVCGVLIVFGCLYHVEKAANISAVTLATGIMATAVEPEIQVGLWHVVAIAILGLMAGYHIKLVEGWYVERVKNTGEEVRGKFLVGVYVISAVAGLVTIAFLTITWVNAILVLLYAQCLYDSFCTYRPRAREFKLA